MVYVRQVTPIGSFAWRRSARCVVVVGVVAGLMLVTDRAEAQSALRTGGLTLLLGPPDAPALGPSQQGQSTLPAVVPQPPQPPPPYMIETQASSGYGQRGHAQTGYARAGAASAQRSQQAQQASNGLFPRLILGPIMGYAVGGTLAVVGSLIGAGLGGCSRALAGDGWSLGSSWCLTGALTGVFAGFLVGTPLGVVWAGEWLHGMGSFVSAFLGSLAGVAVAVIIVAVAQNYAAAYVAGLVPVAGAVIGYELSSSSNASAALAGLALAPIFDHGVFMGGTVGVRFAF